MMEDMEERLSLHSLHSLHSFRSNQGTQQQKLSDISYIDEEPNSKSPCITNNNYTMVTDASGELYFHYINNSYQHDGHQKTYSPGSGSDFSSPSSRAGHSLFTHNAQPHGRGGQQTSNILYLDPLSDFPKLVHETSI